MPAGEDLSQAQRAHFPLSRRHKGPQRSLCSLSLPPSFSPLFTLNRARSPLVSCLGTAGLPRPLRRWHGPCGPIRRGNMAVSLGGRPGRLALGLFGGSWRSLGFPAVSSGSLFGATVSGESVP